MATELDVDFWGRKHKGRTLGQGDELFTPIQLGYHPREDCLFLVKKGVLLAVADGIGETGNIASKYAIEAISHHYQSFLELEDTDAVDPKDFLVDALHKAHKGILQKVEEYPNLDGIGTTLTMAFLRDGKLYTCHVGDSRIYIIRDEKIEQMTEDHSLAALIEREVNKAGSINIKRNLLYQAIGLKDISISATDEIDTNKTRMKIDTRQIELESGDHIVLCSDGLWNMVNEAEIKEATLASRTAAKACINLTNQAVQRGGRDNISVIVLFVDHDGSALTDEKQCIVIKAMSYIINQNNTSPKMFSSVKIVDNKLLLYEDGALRKRSPNMVIVSSSVKPDEKNLKLQDLTEEERSEIEDLLDGREQNEVQSIQVTSKSSVGWSNHVSCREIFRELPKKANIAQIRKEALKSMKNKNEVNEMGMLLLETRHIDLSKRKMRTKIMDWTRGIIARIVHR